MKWTKKAENYSTYDATFKRSETQNQKKFIADLMTCHVFEGLNSCLAQLAEELPRHVQTAYFWPKQVVCEGVKFVFDFGSVFSKTAGFQNLKCQG